MKGLSRYVALIMMIGLAALFGGDSQLWLTLPAAAQEGPASQKVSPVNPTRPFRLPFAEPPGPETWLMGQPYGNTTGAYRRRFTTYGASGGIHFGVDLSAPCGAEIVAIADGVVFGVDKPFGSPPHNLMIDHPQLGYASLYGHLLEAPDLKPGQPVRQGQVIAKVGDSSETCYGRPHLHLEIRDLAHTRKYNPTLLIDAAWHNLALIGNSGRDFARDLDEPRKWQSLYDQPEVQTGGPIVNDFANPWPPDWARGIAAHSNTATPAGLTIPATTPVVASTLPWQATGRRLTDGDCCTNPAWNQDSTQIRFIDQPGAGAPLGVWGVDVVQPLPWTELVTGRLVLYSPNETLAAYPAPDGRTTIIERLADGHTWEIDTQARSPRFTPDSRSVTWTTFDEDAPRDTRSETFWLAAVGGEARPVLTARRTDVVAWLSADALLLTRRLPGGSDETLLTLSVADGRQTELLTLPEPRGMALSPDRRYLAYYVRFEPEAAQNGLWLLDLADSPPTPRKLPFFGAYRWRDNERLIYVPFAPEATEHNFHEYNATTGRTRPLFPAGTNLIIANNDWQVSPDGRKIALVAAKGADLDGVWVLDLPR